MAECPWERKFLKCLLRRIGVKHRLKDSHGVHEASVLSYITARASSSVDDVAELLNAIKPGGGRPERNTNRRHRRNQETSDLAKRS